MRALVIGAGAVGQPYARHLAKGGAEVAVLVKPQHAAEAQAGFTLYPLNRPRRRRARPERFADLRVLTDVAAVGAERWDQVYLTVSSTALRAGRWFAELAPALGEATVILLQPGPRDRAFLREHVPEARVVQGIITLISYRAPLPGEARFAEPGVAYWFPPGSPSPMSGPAARLAEVIGALERGGLPARRHRDVGRIAPFGTALFMPLVAALEGAAWSLRELRRGGRLAVAARAGRQALAAVAHGQGQPAPLALRLGCRALVLRAIARLAPSLVPFDLETYLRVHFTKVGDQTRDALRTFVEMGEAAGLPTEDLRALAGAAN